MEKNNTLENEILVKQVMNGWMVIVPKSSLEKPSDTEPSEINKLESPVSSENHATVRIVPVSEMITEDIHVFIEFKHVCEFLQHYMNKK